MFDVMALISGGVIGGLVVFCIMAYFLINDGRAADDEIDRLNNLIAIRKQGVL